MYAYTYIAIYIYILHIYKYWFGSSRRSALASGDCLVAGSAAARKPRALTARPVPGDRSFLSD